LQDAQSFRWYFLSNALAELGVKIDVMTIKHPDENDSTWKFHENISIQRVQAGILESITMRTKKSLRVDGSGNNELRKSMWFKALKFFNKGFRGFISGVIPGDIRTDWFTSAARYLKKRLRSGNYDFIITSHEPWVDSLLGLYLKKKFPDIKWVADFGDPYVAPYTLIFENALEERIYKGADALIFTSKELISNLKLKYPFLKDKKVMLLEQGFSQRSCSEVERKKRKNNTFTMLYAGTFYKDFRNPENLIKALSMLDFDFTFKLAGRSEDFLKGFRVLGDRFEYLGFVDHFDILKIEKESDILVHLSNKNEIQIPGKIYEYFGALKPILCISYNAGDHAMKIVEDYKRGASCENDPVLIKEAITRLYNSWKEGEEGRYGYEDIYDLSYEHKAALLNENLRAL
jgi:hypothetical protein